MSDSVTLTLGQATIYKSRHRSARQLLEKHPDQPDMLDAINTLQLNDTPESLVFMTVRQWCQFIFGFQNSCVVLLIPLTETMADVKGLLWTFAAEEDECS